jgi:hypothetical protein
MNAGINPFMGGSQLNIPYKVELDVLVKKQLFTASFYDHSANTLDLEQSRRYYSLLYGRAHRAKHLTLSLSAGPSYGHIVHYDEVGSSGGFYPTYTYDKRIVNAFGIQFKVQLITHIDEAGIGLSVDGNINGDAPFIGLGLNVSLGKIAVTP